MSVLVSGLVWERSEHKGSELLTLLAIADNANDNGLAWPGYEHLATKTRLSRRSVQYAVARLLAGDELMIERPGGGPRSNLYRIELAVLRRKPPRKLCTGVTAAPPSKDCTPANSAPVHPVARVPSQSIAPEPSKEPPELHPPNPPEGGTPIPDLPSGDRKRDRERFQAEVLTLAVELYPAVGELAERDRVRLAETMERAIRKGARDGEAVRDWIDTHAGDLAEAAS